MNYYTEVHTGITLTPLLALRERRLRQRGAVWGIHSASR
jgi:hypothetical protein